MFQYKIIDWKYSHWSIEKKTRNKSGQILSLNVDYRESNKILILNSIVFERK